MRKLAERIVQEFDIDGQVSSRDAVELAHLVLQLKVMRCGTCQESNLINKPELLD